MAKGMVSAGARGKQSGHGLVLSGEGSVSASRIAGPGGKRAEHRSASYRALPDRWVQASRCALRPVVFGGALALLSACVPETRAGSSVGTPPGKDRVTVTQSRTTSSSTATVSGTPTGRPLEIRFSGFGDGASHFGGVYLTTGDGASLEACRPGSGCREFTVTHRYAKAGTYQATLRGTGEGDASVLARTTITVGP